MLICLGVYPNNYAITTTQANELAGYLQAGGNCYMEGGDAWCYDPAGAIYRGAFAIDEAGDGGTMSGNIDGVTGTFTQGMSFAYAGENNYMDRILPVSPAFSVFTNGGYDRTVAYDEGTYKTVGSSFELGGLIDGTFPSTKDKLIEEILDFLGITTGIEEYQEPTKVLGIISAFPNPATGHLKLSTNLERTMQVSIDFYNVLGQRVKRLVHSTFPPGDHEFEWNFCDKNNRELAPGTYFYRVDLGDEALTGKVLLIK
jgi:hypothetical protein